jgi:hypothetical protein
MSNDGDDAGHDNFQIGSIEFVSIHSLPFEILLSFALLLYARIIRRQIWITFLKVARR